MRSNWQRSFNDSSSFTHSLDQRQQTQFSGAVNAGILDIGLSGKGQITVVGNDGEKVSFNVSEQTAQAFAKDQARVRAESIQNTFTGSQGLDYLTDISKKIAASESYSFLDDARRVEAATQSYGANMQTAFVKDYAIKHFGDESPENIRKAMGRMAYMAQDDPEALNRMIEGFVSGNGYGWGRTNSNVSSVIDAMQNRTHDDAILKSAVDYSAGTAQQTSSGITPDILTPPDQKVLREPDETNTQDKADSLRSRNRFEESPGNGRIRTSAAGMATESVGKVFKGVVDSQGNRPTDEGFYDYVGTTRKLKDALPVGPIAKDAPSTLGGKR
jgi:conjugal transfer mating pair stabilization protein TraG